MGDLMDHRGKSAFPRRFGWATCILTAYLCVSVWRWR